MFISFHFRTNSSQHRSQFDNNVGGLATERREVERMFVDPLPSAGARNGARHGAVFRTTAAAPD